MPITVQHIKNVTIADGTDSNVVRPSDWNSAHAITYSPTGQEIVGAFSNANGISFGTNAQSAVTASYTVPIVPAQTAFVFADSNGVSFGTNGSTVTATVKTDYLTTAMASNAGTNFVATSQSSLFQHTSATSAITSNAAHSTHTHAAYLTTARASNDGVGLNTAGTNVTWTVNSGGISLNAGAYLTTAMASNAGSNFLSTSQSSLFQHTSATSAITSAALHTSASRVINVVAGTASNGGTASLSGNVSFSNANGISWYTSAGGAVVGTVATNYAASNITTNNVATSQSSLFQHTSATSAITSAALHTSNSSLLQHTSATSAITSNAFPSANTTKFAGTGTSATNASITLNSNGLAISVAAPGGGGNTMTVSAANGSFQSNAITFADSNGVSFSTGTQGVFATVATNYAATNVTTNNVATSQSSLFQFTSATSAITSAALHTSNSSLLQHTSATSAITANALNTSVSRVINIVAGTASNGGTASVSGNVSFSNANGISWYTSAGGAVVGTVATNYAASNVTTNNVATSQSSLFQHTSATSAITSAAQHTSNNSLFQYTSATSAITINAAHSTHSHGMVTTTTNGSLVTVAGNSGGYTLAVPPFVTAAAGGGDGYNIIGVNGAGTSASTTLQLSNANNVTFGLNAGTITASASYPAQTVDTNKAGIGYTSTTQAGTTVGATHNTQGLSMAWPPFITTYVAQTVQPVAFSASGGSSNFSTLTFSNLANGVTFSNSAGQVAMSHSLQQLSNTSAITANAINTSQSSLFQHTSATSAITSNAAHSTHTHTANFYVSGNTTQLSSTAGIDMRSVSFEGAGIASVGVSNGRVLVSVPSGGGAGDGYNIIAAAGSTAATTGTILFSNANGVSFGLNGATMTASVNAGGGGVTNTLWFPFNEAVNVMGQQGQGTLHLVPVPTPDIGGATVTFDRLCFPILHTHATNSTGSVTLSMWYGLYTREATNGTRISLAHSTSFSTGYTFSGTANSSILSGLRLITVPWTSSIAGNRYVVGIISRTTTGGANCTISQLLVSNLNSNFSGILGQTTNATYQWPMGWGQYSATTSALPASIAYSQIYGTNSNAMRNPEWFLVNSTA